MKKYVKEKFYTEINENLKDIKSSNSIHLFTGYEDNSKFIVPRDTNYFTGDNKLAIVRIASN